MARPVSTSITCPTCGRPFGAILEQILDVTHDPTVKERLLSGRVNLITCPQCGYRGMVGTPLMYHDPSKQLAVVYVPMELGLEQGAREKLIGDMTNAVIRNMPEDMPKGYLLQPKTALTMQGLLDQILEADGITQDMLDLQRRKVGLIDEIIRASSEELEGLLADNSELFDLEFLELLTAASQAASQANDNRRSLRLLNVRSRLMDTTEAGQILKAQEAALVEASEELKALGEKIDRAAFVELLVNAAGNPLKVDALATLGRALLDYTTFQLLTEHINATADEDYKQALTAVRDRLLEVNAEYEKQARALLQRSAETLRLLLQSGDIAGAIRNNLDRIDDMFLQVLQANLDESKRTGNVELSSRLKQVRDEVLKLIQDSAPPVIRLINELLSVETEEEALQMLQARQTDVTEDFPGVAAELAEQLRSAGNELAAQRLDVLRLEAQKILG